MLPCRYQDAGIHPKDGIHHKKIVPGLPGLRTLVHSAIAGLLVFGGMLLPLRGLTAFHGIWLPSFGSDQAGVAGAFYSPFGSPLVLEENPAMLGRVRGHSFQASLAVNRARVNYSDQYLDPATGTYYSNNRDFKPVAPLPAFGYAYGEENWAAGMALYVQGGGGADFQDLLRPFPETEMRAEGLNSQNAISQQTGLALEDTQARFALIKLSPGLSFRSGNWNLGFAVDLVHATKRLDRTYAEPGTGVILPGGIHYRSDPALAAGAKAGLYYSDGPYSFALSFTSMSRFYLDGRIRTDTYEPARAGHTGVSRYMEWPARFVAGMEYRFSDYRFVLDVSHTLWSHSMNSMLFTLESANVVTPLGSTSPYLRMNLRWKDQTVLSMGLERQWDALVLRAGYSYGPTVQSEAGVNPLLGTTVEHHVSLGMGWLWSRDEGQPSSLDIALQYSFPHTVSGAPLSDWWLGHAIQTNLLRAAIFNYEKTTEVITLYAGFTYRWSSEPGSEK